MTRRVIFTTALVILVVLAGWYEGLYRPESSHIHKLQAEEQTASADLLALHIKYLGLLNSEKRLPEERAALQKLSEAVPNGPELDNLVKTLFSAAAASGLQLDSISSPPPAGFGVAAVGAPAAGPAELQLSLVVNGTPSAVDKLYTVLDADPRLFVIDNFAQQFVLNAGKGEGSAAASTTIDVRAFYATPTSQDAAS